MDREAEEEVGESQEERQRRIRCEAKTFSEEVFSSETISHLVKASIEFILAIDSMIPRDRIPKDVVEHYTNAKKESILLLRALLNAQLKTVEETQERKGLQKIDLD